ncbi:hypothetical protein ACMD2_25583 [Ananas comosus]|uniref:Glycosyltransferase BC10 n=1 Tax=Ananas comosus TaxID=4615 RepID=A0A199VZT7_ANACO|nr:hypothetical protein ACMD2_25583 [Ananas comosus]
MNPRTRRIADLLRECLTSGVAAPFLCCLSLSALAFAASCLTLHLTFFKFPPFQSLFSASHHLLYLPKPSNTTTPHHAPPPSNLWHEMSDEELLRKATTTTASCGGTAEERKKVAFMFLTRGRMPLAPLWQRFFHGHDSRLFSVYVHAPPEFTEEPPRGSVFFQRRIPSKPVQWGESSMVDAERRLLANALLDPSNCRFVLLSDSCIPLFNFSAAYGYLAGSHLSFVSSFDDPGSAGRGRYNRRMRPTVSLAEWRKGSQWFAVHRELAVGIVSDRRYYPVFREHCRPPCYADEHYIPTLVSKLFPARNANRSVTWVDWSGGGPHPAVYRRRDVSEGLLRRMRDGSTMSRCSYNERPTSICFLFARKFDASALEPLMLMAPALLGF